MSFNIKYTSVISWCPDTMTTKHMTQTPVSCVRKVLANSQGGELPRRWLPFGMACRSAPLPTRIQSPTPSSRAWLLQYRWGGCAIPLDPSKSVAEKSQKTWLLAGWKKACTIPNSQNCSQTWRDSLSPRHPVWTQTGFCPGVLMLPPEGGDEVMMDYMQQLVWFAPWLLKR